MFGHVSLIPSPFRSPRRGSIIIRVKRIVSFGYYLFPSSESSIEFKKCIWIRIARLIPRIRASMSPNVVVDARFYDAVAQNRRSTFSGCRNGENEEHEKSHRANSARDFESRHYRVGRGWERRNERKKRRSVEGKKKRGWAYCSVCALAGLWHAGVYH